MEKFPGKLTIPAECQQAMKVQVRNLLSQSSSSSGRGGMISLRHVAGAFATSPAIERRLNPSDSLPKSGSVSWMRKIWGMAGAKEAAQQEQENTQRKYQFVDCLNQIQQRPEFHDVILESWEQVQEALQEFFEFEQEDKEEEELVGQENAVMQDDSVQRCIVKLETAQLQNQSDDLLPSNAKWKRIQVVPKQSKIRSPASQQDGWKSVTDQADDMLVIRVEEAFDDHKKRYSQSLKELEERRLQKQLEEEAKERASQLMRPLTAEEQAIVNEAIYSQGPPGEIIAGDDIDTVQRSNMQTLQPCQWLSDEVIHYFLLMLSKRDEEICRQDPGRKRSHFFKSFFITKLLNEGHSNPEIEGTYEFKNVKRWSKKVPGKDIFNLDKIIFPINQNNMHWLCAVAFMQEKRIQLYDSMGSRGLYYLKSIFRYIQDEHKAKKGSDLPDIDQWELVPTTSDTPRQRNGESNMDTYS